MDLNTKIFYFIRKKFLDYQDYFYLSRYDSRTIYIIRYSKISEWFEQPKMISEDNKQKNIFLLCKVSENTNDIFEHIKKHLLYEDKNIVIDVSNASPYHSSKLTAMGIRWGFDVICQFDEEGEKITKRRTYYEVISPDERKILEAINLEPQSFRDIISYGDLNESMCRSNMFKLLSRLCDRELLSMASIKTDPGTKGKPPRGYRMTDDQYLDFRSFIEQHDKEMNRIELADRKKIDNRKARRDLRSKRR